METKQGTARTAFIFKSIAIKLPRIYLRRALRETYRHWKAKRLLSILRHDADCFTTPQNLLFRGIRDNWREFRFYRRHRSNFLLPTYFSLLGFANIQKQGVSLQCKDLAVWCQMFALTNSTCWADSHTFSNPANFCVEDGHLRMIDYASVRAQKVINQYGERIFREFDVSACIKAEK